MTKKPTGVSLAVPQSVPLPERSDIAETASHAVAAREKASIEAQYLMALQRPRDWLDAEQRLLRECERPGFAATAIYAKPQGTKTVTGPSIRFVEAALRCARNVATRAAVVYDDREQRVMRVSVIDLESNVSYDEDVVIDKTVERRSNEGREVLAERTNKQGQKVYIVAATEDEVLTKQNNQRSKAIRNCGIRIVPGDIIESAKARITETRQSEDARDPMAAVKRTVAAFYDIGVDAGDLEKLIGHPIDRSTAAERQFLFNVYTALREGETTWDEVLGTVAQAPTAKKGVEGLKARLAEKREKDAPTEAGQALADVAKDAAATTSTALGLVETDPAKLQEAGAAAAEPAADDRRTDLLADLEGATLPELHARIKDEAWRRGVKGLKDINALVMKTFGVASYQEIQTREQAVDLILAMPAVTA